MRYGGLWLWTSILAGLVLAATAAAATFQLPQDMTAEHQGVVSCYGSTCHSRQEPTGAIVMQNEVQIWQDVTRVSGAHLRAYRVLADERSKAIAAKLGLKDAETAPECLSCHADPVPAERRGERFQISDGVGCEACHGGGGDWLTQHYDFGATHQTNIAAGLYPLSDPLARAELCLTCHLGSDRPDQFVSHRMIAAGHPRMSFELDLFTLLQAHHLEDGDYERRKGIQSGARIWAIGQAKALQNQLYLFLDGDLGRDGLFPELIFYDCFACHREVSDQPDWRPEVRLNPMRPAVRGVPKFNDAHMIMLKVAAVGISPELADRVRDHTLRLHLALESGTGVRGAVNGYTGLTEELIAAFRQHEFTRADHLQILRDTVSETTGRAYTDYQATEQAIMALDTMLSSMVSAGMTSEAVIAAMRADIEVAYDAVADPNTYDQDRLVEALSRINVELEAL